MYDEADEDDRYLVVNELDHSTSYTFQVRAVDTKGDEDEDMGETTWAPASGTVGVAETDLAEEPDQVEDLELVAGDMMIMATWRWPRR